MKYKLLAIALALLSLALCILIVSSCFDPLSPTGRINKPPAVLLVVFYTLVAGILLWLAQDWKTNLPRVVLSIAVILVLVAIGEGVVRIFHPAHATSYFQLLYSPTLHHVNPPNTTMTFAGLFLPAEPGEVAGRLAEMTTNEIGLRSPYTRAEFLDHDDRLIILGDSFVFGVLVDQDSAFPAVIERELRRQLGREDIAVLNAGNVSSSPFLEQMLLHSVLSAWRPTLVVTVLDATDIGDDHQYMRGYSPGGDPPFPKEGLLKLLDDDKSLLDNSALYHRLYMPIFVTRNLMAHPLFMVTENLNPSSIDLTIDGVAEHNRYFIYRHNRKKIEPFFRQTLKNVTDTARLARELGAGFLFVVAPRFHHWDNRACPENWEAEEYALDELFEFEYLHFFEEARDEVDFPILNLLPTFKQNKERSLVFINDPHWNKQGHALVAETVVNLLLDERMIDLGPSFISPSKDKAQTQPPQIGRTNQ